ncbi:hypothetical protein [Acetobacter senegalensis]|uniref:hypothetical protein n=1 Tax=Acetobacter senegalensis TaxID=446692 RepID=UPI00128D6B9C|nr:hypothetical protein [Acetobacter senegalensis]MCG4258767.1 hypothetical protein [Acetobacter senegalensis]MCG4268666.1 hypothetical protein [Acetobacter senegalensis]MPQ72357.1 hypothetical protein [Acetobacter senegalensis]
MLAALLQTYHTGGFWGFQYLGVPAGIRGTERRNYSMIVIGLYAAAAGYSKNDLLSSENTYAKVRSKFGNEPRITAYPYFSPRSSDNTLLGFYHEKNFSQ